MTDTSAVSVSNVCKQYFVFENQRARLRHAFWPTSLNGVSETWALRDISFEVNKGEAVGIIGRNGSGKSTLLQIITGTLQPTSGSTHVTGRVAALLELGSGFNPEFTGKDNVFLNGMLMGLSRAEVENRFDRIVGFADIGDVLDQPVKTYSSGMLIRLAFSVQIALDPDVLIVDEALSVGDYFFRQKCYERITQLRDGGMTLLFVTHDMNTISNICNRALYLTKGELAFDGHPNRAIRAYLGQSLVTRNAKVGMAGPLWCSNGNEKSERGAIVAVSILDLDGESASSVRIGEELVVRIRFQPDPLREAQVYLQLKNVFNEIIMTTGSYFLNLPIHDLDTSLVSELEFRVEMAVGGGEYSLQVMMACPEPPNGVGRVESRTGPLGPIAVGGDYTIDRAPFLGPFGLPVRATITS